jgi:Bacterial Ig-like domain (group 3)/SdrD B-like domain/Beta-propeller repeat
MKPRTRRLRLDRLESRALPSSPGDIDWVHQFGSFDPAIRDPVRGVATAAGNVYVVGDLPETGALPGQTSAGGSDAYLRKYDAAGTELWTRQFGTDADDQAFAVAADDSGVFVAGLVGGTLPGQAGAGSDAFVRKYDLDGNELWTRQFGSTGFDQASGIAVGATGVYVAGLTSGTLPGQTSAGNFDAFVRKYDAAGNELWTRQFGTADVDGASGISVDASGVYVVGSVGGEHFVGSLPVGGGFLPGQTSAGAGDAFVRKYDPAGNEIWTRQFGSADADGATAVSVGASGVYVVGSVGGSRLVGGGGGSLPGQTSAGYQDAFVREYDAAGNQLWTRQFGSTGLDNANGVAVDAGGVYVAGGLFGTLPGQVNAGSGDAFLRKLDASGAELWTHQFGTDGDDAALAIATDASGVYVGGATTGIFPGQIPFGGEESFVRKYDAGGTDVWTREFTGLLPGEDFARAVDADGNVYVAGVLNGILIEGEPVSGGFVRKYDAAGNVLWTRQVDAATFDEIDGIAVDASGVYVAGTIDFGAVLPGQAGAGDRDAFVRRYDADGNEVWTRQFGSPGDDQATAIAIDSTGVYVAGTTFGSLAGSSGGQDAFVRAYSSGGSLLWTSQFGSPGDDQATGVAAGASGIYVSGTTTGALPGQTSSGRQDAFVRRLNPGGAEGWTRQFGTAGADSATGVAADGSGVYVGGFTAGAFAGQTSSGGDDAFVRKFDAGGADVWTRQFGTPGSDRVNGLTSGGAGVYVAGQTDGTLPGQTGAGDQDAFVSRFDADGNPVWTRQFGTPGADAVVGIAVSAAGLFVAGTTTGTFPGQTSAGGQNVFAARLVDSASRAATATTVAASAPTPLFGVDGVTITATVLVNPPGSGTPTGAVTFFDGDSALGTVDVVNGIASLALGNTVLTAGPHTIRAVYGGAGGFQGSESAVGVTVLAPSAVQGLVYVDFNNDGQVDFGERAVASVIVTLTGTDDLGHAVNRTVPTDVNGVYAFINLRPSDAAGYTVGETQPAGLADGRDTPGTVNGAPAGGAAANDTFAGIVLPRGGSVAENYNFGERPATNGSVTAGQTATIGYWQNRNGQNLILALNGSASATQLGHWLARTFPNLYAALDGWTNSQVATYYKGLFARTALTAPAGPPKADAQVMATALAVYVTNQSLAGTAAAAYGFQVTADGVGTRPVNVAGDGAGFGLANNSTHSVLDLLLAVDARSHAGVLEDADGNGRIDTAEAGYRTQANDVFTAINEAGDI